MDYSNTLVHQLSFKTPAKRAVMSGDGLADFASKMRNCVKYLFPIENPTKSLESSTVDPYNKISSFLYLGSIDSLEHADKFYLIVNCTRHIKVINRQRNFNCMDSIRIPVDDHPTECATMLKYIESTKVLEKIHECRMASKPVLVHCHAGIQRSATIVACYLMKYYKITPEEAIRFIQSKRPIAFYNQANFMDVIQHVYSHK